MDFTGSSFNELVARDVMRPAVSAVGPDTPLRDVAEIIWRSDHDGLCVVDGGELVGVITEANFTYQERSRRLPLVLGLMDALGEDEHAKQPEVPFATLTAADVMSGEPHTVDAEYAAQEVAALMVERQLSFVPVLEQGGLVGAVTHRSLLRAAFSLD